MQYVAQAGNYRDAGLPFTGALNVLSRIDDELLASVREKSARLVGRLTV